MLDLSYVPVLIDLTLLYVYVYVYELKKKNNNTFLQQILRFSSVISLNITLRPLISPPFVEFYTWKHRRPVTCAAPESFGFIQTQHKHMCRSMPSGSGLVSPLHFLFSPSLLSHASHVMGLKHSSGIAGIQMSWGEPGHLIVVTSLLNTFPLFSMNFTFFNTRLSRSFYLFQILHSKLLKVHWTSPFI